MIPSHSVAMSSHAWCSSSGEPNILISGLCHPVTMLSAKRPTVMGSMVVARLAARTGWIVGAWEVAKIPGYFVSAPMPAA